MDAGNAGSIQTEHLSCLGLTVNKDGRCGGGGGGGGGGKEEGGVGGGTINSCTVTA